MQVALVTSPGTLALLLWSLLGYAAEVGGCVAGARPLLALPTSTPRGTSSITRHVFAHTRLSASVPRILSRKGTQNRGKTNDKGVLVTKETTTAH